MLTYLAEEPELFGGAKLLVNEEVLLIIYMGKGLELPTDLLATLAEDVEAKAFVPLNATSSEPRRIWKGPALEYHALCEPVL